MFEIETLTALSQSFTTFFGRFLNPFRISLLQLSSHQRAEQVGAHLSMSQIHHRHVHHLVRVVILVLSLPRMLSHFWNRGFKRQQVVFWMWTSWLNVAFVWIESLKLCFHVPTVTALFVSNNGESTMQLTVTFLNHILHLCF